MKTNTIKIFEVVNAAGEVVYQVLSRSQAETYATTLRRVMRDGKVKPGGLRIRSRNFVATASPALV